MLTKAMYSEYFVILKCSFYKNSNNDAKNDRGGGRQR